MAIDNSQTIDGLGFDKATGEAVLLISDHLDWIDLARHADLLGQKLTAYVHFIESGQLTEMFPKAEGCPVKISLVYQFRPDNNGEQYLANVAAELAKQGIALAHGRLPAGY